jgi:DNA-binding response OmpR family regulator
MSVSKILVVDDELIGRQLLDAILRREKYTTFLANSGYEAIEACRNNLPDLILLDVMMPALNGFETILEIKKDELLQNIPIILVTALEDRDSKIRGLECGANDFITKPFDRIELLSKIKNLLSITSENSESIIAIPQRFFDTSDYLSAIDKEINFFSTTVENKFFEIYNINRSEVNLPGRLCFAFGEAKYCIVFGIDRPGEDLPYQKSLITLWILQFFYKPISDKLLLTGEIKYKIENSEFFKNNSSGWWLIMLRVGENKHIDATGFNQKIQSIRNKTTLSILSGDSYTEIFSEEIDSTVITEKLIFVCSTMDEKIPLEVTGQILNDIKNMDYPLNIGKIKTFSDRVKAQNAFVIRII